MPYRHFIGTWGKGLKLSEIGPFPLLLFIIFTLLFYDGEEVPLREVVNQNSALFNL
jgi:hypothetical protein